MEGVVVSARASDKTFTTSVFTDQQGSYEFPTLDAGQYYIWAQAKGFEAARSELALVAGGRTTGGNLTLRPTEDAEYLANQLDGAEWYASLPEATPQDRRMKSLFKGNCTACHPPSFTLPNRFDARGWKLMIDVMARTGGIISFPLRNGPGNETWQAYKEELGEYLGRVTKTLKPRPDPRPSGAATQVVITEYDIPRQDRPLMVHNGSDWSLGTPARWEGKGAHEAHVDSKGNVWVADDRSPARTTGRLDTRTGKFYEFALPFPETPNVAVDTHGIWIDKDDNAWFGGGGIEGGLLTFDTKAEKFQYFPRPAGAAWLVGGEAATDSKGNAWGPTTAGAVKLDPKTGQYTEYTVPYGVKNPKARGAYGITVDANDTVWVARPGAESVAWIDSRTGQVGEVQLEPLVIPGITDRDHEIRNTMQVGANAGPPDGKAPRRLAADPKGNMVWVGLYKADRIAGIDIRTKQAKEYPLPHAGSLPYGTAVDRTGIVWIPLLGADRVASFDPKTEQFTEYQLPSRGTDIRHVSVDNSTNPPSVWASYNRTNKIVHLQPRTAGNQQTAR